VASLRKNGSVLTAGGQQVNEALGNGRDGNVVLAGGMAKSTRI
jgi:hypothetical protein